MSHYEGDLRAPANARFAIIAARWNARITDVLVTGARECLAANGVDAGAVDVVRVPGAWEVALAAERFRQAIEEEPVMLAGCATNALALTISLGTTCSAGQDTVQVERLLKQADDALYQSKAQGRNRVTRFGLQLV